MKTMRLFLLMGLKTKKELGLQCTPETYSCRLPDGATLFSAELNALLPAPVLGLRWRRRSHKQPIPCPLHGRLIWPLACSWDVKLYPINQSIHKVGLMVHSNVAILIWVVPDQIVASLLIRNNVLGVMQSSVMTIYCWAFFPGVTNMYMYADQ